MRGRLGKTQVEFADALGVSFRSIQGYESGRQAIPSDVLKGLRAQYGTSSDWMLYGPDVAPETGDRFARSAELAQRVYDVWETLLSSAPIPVPVDAKAILFNIFVEIAMRDGELPMAQMQQAARKIVQRIDPKY